MITIDSLFVHYIKSCAARQVDDMDIHSRGPAFDRQWMVVREKDGQFLTQRQYPKMALIHPRLRFDGLCCNGFFVTAPGRPHLFVPYPEDAKTIRPVTVWKH